MTDQFLQSMSQLEKSTGVRGGQIASSKLQNLQPGKRQQRQWGGVSSRGRQHGDDFQRGKEAENPAKLLESTVVTEVGDVSAEVINWSTGEEALQLGQRFDPGVNIVKPYRVELEDQRPLDQRLGVALHELHQ